MPSTSDAPIAIRLDAVSSSVVTAFVAAAVGASLTAVTLIVSVLGVGSNAVPSLTEKVKPAYALPLAFAAGVKNSLPAAISAAVMT